MPQLNKDITAASEWITQCFGSIGLKLDYSLDSIMHIDGFLQMSMANSQPIPGTILASNFGQILFGLGAYLGETIIRHAPGAAWMANGEDPQTEVNVMIQLPDGGQLWPMMKVIKRAQNGFEDSVYPYAYEITKPYGEFPFNAAFWDIGNLKSAKKPWYKFW